MSNNVMGASSSSLDELSNYLEEQILGVSSVFVEIDKLMLDLSVYCKDNIGSNFQNKYLYLSDNYAIIKENLETIKQDFINIKNNHITFDANYKTKNAENTTIEGGDYTGVKC